MYFHTRVRRIGGPSPMTMVPETVVALRTCMGAWGGIGVARYDGPARVWVGNRGPHLGLRVEIGGA